MGKKGGKKDKKGKKGAEKPETMSDDEWALFNNVAELVMNLRGQSPLNTVTCLIDRGKAAFYLWQHACCSESKRDEIISCGAVDQAKTALKFVDAPERPACAGLIHSLSAHNEVTREALCSTKPVYPQPSINLLPMLIAHIGGNSIATEVSCVGTLANLMADAVSRVLVVKEVIQNPTKLIRCMFESVSYEARSKAAECLKEGYQIADGKLADQFQEALIKVGCHVVCLDLLKAQINVSSYDDAQVGAVKYTAHLVTGVTCLLKHLLKSEEVKRQVTRLGGVNTLAAIVSSAKVWPEDFPLTHEAQAAVARCLSIITIPYGFNNKFVDQLQKINTGANSGTKLGGDGFGMEGVDRGEGSDYVSDESDLEEDNDDDQMSGYVQSVVEQLSKNMSSEELEAARESLTGMVTNLEKICFEVAQSGVVKSLVGMLSGPQAEAVAGGGKSKKKAKEPPMPPGMSECQQSAACVLRHLSLFPPMRREILLAGAVPKLAKLVESKNEHTRMHSQGILMNLGVDDDAIVQMKEVELPEYILLMANQHLLEEIAHPVPVPEEEQKRRDEEEKAAKAAPKAGKKKK